MIDMNTLLALVSFGLSVCLLTNSHNSIRVFMRYLLGRQAATADTDTDALPATFGNRIAVG
jgi:hypothetical protein